MKLKSTLGRRSTQWCLEEADGAWLWKNKLEGDREKKIIADQYGEGKANSCDLWAMVALSLLLWIKWRQQVCIVMVKTQLSVLDKKNKWNIQTNSMWKYNKIREESMGWNLHTGFIQLPLQLSGSFSHFIKISVFLQESWVLIWDWTPPILAFRYPIALSSLQLHKLLPGYTLWHCPACPVVFSLDFKEFLSHSQPERLSFQLWMPAPWSGQIEVGT